MSQDHGVRVLRVITRLNIGGPAIQAVRLSASLTGAGFHTLLLHGRVGEAEGDMSYLLAPHGPNAVRALQIPVLQRPIAPWSDFRAFVTILRTIASFRPHIVHTHMAKAGLLARAAAALYNGAHPWQRVRIVHTYHGHVLDGYFSGAITRLFIALERALAGASDRLIAVSSLVRDDLLYRHRIGSPETFIVVPLGLDLDVFAAVDAAARASARRTLGIPAEAAVVTTVGRLTAIKNHRLFLDVAEQIAADGRSIVFLIAGDGELRAGLERDAAARGLASAVRFLGWRRDLAMLYAATDVFAITSSNEGTPVALIEAMAAGVPGVATDVGGVRDVIVDGSMGIVVPADDGAAFASAVDALLTDPSRRGAMGAAARRSVLGRFAFERLTADIAKLYRELT